MPSALLGGVVEQRRLADPGSPTSASTPLWPAARLGQQPVERQPLVVAAEQHRARDADRCARD